MGFLDTIGGVAGGLGGLFSGFGGLISGFGSLFGGNNNNDDSARQQYEYQMDFYKHRHQWEVQDLIAAGLNPMLSAHGSPPMGGNVDVVGSRKLNQVDRLQVMAQLANTAADIQLKKAQVRNVDAQTTNAITSNSKIVAETDEKRYIVDTLLPSEAKLKSGSYLKLLEEVQEVKARSVNLSSHTALNQVLSLINKYKASIEGQKSVYLKSHPDLVPYELGAGHSLFGAPALGSQGGDIVRKTGIIKWIADLIYGSETKNVEKKSNSKQVFSPMGDFSY